MKTVLLTGAAGFIGWKTAEFLLKEGHKVIGVDNLNNYYDVRLKEYRKKDLEKYENFKFYPVDIENLQALEILFNDYKFDVVINLAARAGVRYSMINPYVYMTTNANGTLNLLDLMKKYGVKKFVLASTSSLYAGQPMPFKEDLPVNTPISPYAASKKAAEVMAYTYHYLYGIDVSVVRYFTVYGPAGRPDMSIFRFIKWIDEGKPIILYGDGSQSRDFTYVDDIASGTILATKELGYEIINLGGGKNPISLKRVIETIEAHLGKKAVIDYRPFHKADLKETWADITKAKNLLGWEPKVSFEDGIKKTVDWYLENRDWLKYVEVGNE
ncbi:SDR family NAD(P)-dependent oxidoreductase [Sulfurihydrogenibium sp.]|jgi:nucleoside-diphosphate-sugar epimerase|uniref:SDR family NAD(P)-dependent oxidoreductase n=1 Tax=Sulfurihydrogenibium sp. TaxID=2053621 RepID=UPI00260654F6|nr:SDR family NAD(P)-dependent oxidoreductase [Sulfurihydrogenibium sp.]